MKTDYESFNIIGFLDKYGVSYKTSGKNIASGWIGVEICPFCSVGGFHFGINLSSNRGSCWACGEAVAIPKIITGILQCDWKETYKIINELSEDKITWIPKENKPGESVIFPDGLKDSLTKRCREYLLKRKYNPEELLSRFKIKCTIPYSTLSVEGKTWDFSERIIIPVYMNRTLQCYIGRDYTGEAYSKYMISPTVACIKNPHSCIYNFDTLTGKVIFVEGTTDVWRFGSKCGAMLGKSFTRKQVQELIPRNIKEATVLFDQNADKSAYKLANALTSIIPSVKVAFIEEDDPGSMDQTEALKVKYQLIGEI